MTTDKDALSYGQYLKARRLEKGVRLKKISQVTRIGRDILFRIENEDAEALPAEVFVKGFLRAYAEVIGIDGEEVVQKYLSQRESEQEPVEPEKIYVRPRRRLWPLLLTVFVILAGLILVSIYLFGEPPSPKPAGSALNTPAEKAPSPMPVPEAVPQEATEEAATGPAPSAENPPPPAPETPVEEPITEESVPPAAVEPQELNLTVVAKEETWMKVIIDGGRSHEYTLSAGERLDLAGKAKFNLLIGNAGGVDLALNGAPVEIPGRTGQVLTLQLP